MTADWRYGTGTYIGDDVSTYIVKDPDGQFVVGFVVGSTVGNGSAVREVTRRSGEIIVSIRRGRGESADLPEIVLKDGMTGWWKIGGEVFSVEEPVQIDTRPARKVVSTPPPASKADTSPVVQVKQPVQQPALQPPRAELPEASLALVRKFADAGAIYKGPGGIVLLSEEGQFFAPDDHPVQMGEHLTPEHRFEFLRALRNAPEAVTLTQVQYTKFPAGAQVRPHQGDEAPGLYWEEGPGKASFICERRDAVHFSFAANRPDGIEAAVNNAPRTPKRALGVLTGAGFAFPYTHENNPSFVLVHCPRGGNREVTLLLETATGSPGPMRTDLALVTFDVTKSVAGKEARRNDEHRTAAPRYVVARDTKGVGRIFLRP